MKACDIKRNMMGTGQHVVMQTHVILMQPTAQKGYGLHGPKSTQTATYELSKTRESQKQTKG